MAVLPFDPDFRRRSAAGAPRPARAPEPGRRMPRPADRPVERLPERGADRVVPWPVAIEPRPGAAPRAEPPAEFEAEPALDESALARRFFPLALAVAAVDLVTKALAVAHLPAERATAGPMAGLHLVFNGASAGGVSLGEHTRAINVIATGTVIGLLVMLVPHLARLDRRATRALALVAGGGLGNLASLLTSTRGVPDFLAVPQAHGAWVLNVADLAIAAGLALLAPVVGTLVRAIRVHGAHAEVGRRGVVAAR